MSCMIRHFNPQYNVLAVKRDVSFPINACITLLVEYNLSSIVHITMSSFEGYLFLILICLISTIFIVKFFKSTRAKSNLPPSPFRLPIIGHLHLLTPLPHQAFHRLSLRYGPIFQLFMGSEPCVVACSPETAVELLKTSLDRPQNTAVTHITYGLKDFAFAPYGTHWKSMKKIVMSQLLNGKAIDLLQPDRRDEITRFLKTLSEKASVGKAVNLEAELVKVTNNLITRITLGQRCSENAGEADDIRKLIYEITEVIGIFNLSDSIRLLKRLDLQRLLKRAKDIHRRYDALIEKIMKEHEEARKKGTQPQGKDLLNLLLDMAEDESMEIDLSRENIKAFILNIFVAGTDNSAITTEWALSELINHPKVMKKAIEEIDHVVGKNRLLQESDIPNLPYLQAIIKETLRLHPPVPMIPRRSIEDGTVAGYNIQANTTVFINVWAVGRDPNYWESPLEFRPERFQENRLDVRGQHSEFLPFGSGGRMCPGTSLGWKMVHATFGAMLQCFEWKAGKDGNLPRVDMDEGIGLSNPRANRLVCVPVARLDPTLLSIN
ncbi:putative 3,9-dihydroxypterocarpan 6A-monooxygenase [Helianthus annuus]|nr:putative 3,9-dihydroxypterocarpan 6A-monooxygenase [Helianthus annuus]KAJ0574852.1 putative 3,9-dihydroxypterocarpan 6A-monooxygenase [Helianthus annuus]KAJ0739181.1 putative 3,9-dihydroxypterocarpan 6A-monooxygenase [Helianthus annuus]KAJ0742033.1 putative 3,9-dihydroxypterocarpan 6A-monooxygenase [Helianthus annuus]KAJ0913453.1 putative 3,9-dihydroxypterocarpan 6A-monooxygenase [Helianthus annuus]